MPRFGGTSQQRLQTCDAQLQIVMREVVAFADCTIVEGHRSEQRQDMLFMTGKSKVVWPDGKHNTSPSKAVDVAPYVDGKISWDVRHCCYLAGCIMGTARVLGVKLRWGGNWDQDQEIITDQQFQDLVHYELVER